MQKFNWTKRDGGHQCAIGELTLFVVPDRYAKGFQPKAARGTKWRAGVTHWCERTRTASRFGRDTYADLQDNAKDAMRLAETVYADAVSVREIVA